MGGPFYGFGGPIYDPGRYCQSPLQNETVKLLHIGDLVHSKMTLEAPILVYEENDY